MKHHHIFTVVAITVAASACDQAQYVDVADLVCDSVAVAVTPEVVERNPSNYTGKAICWVGKITDIQEATKDKVFVLPVGRYRIHGQTMITMTVAGDGTFAPGLYPHEAALAGCDYLISGTFSRDVHKDDYLMFVGQVLGTVNGKPAVGVAQAYRFDQHALFAEGLPSPLSEHPHLFPQFNTEIMVKLREHRRQQSQ